MTNLDPVRRASMTGIIADVYQELKHMREFSEYTSQSRAVFESSLRYLMSDRLLVQTYIISSELMMYRS